MSGRPEFLRVVRHHENLPGQLEAIDRLLEGTDWRRVGYYPAPSRDIGLQRLPGRGDTTAAFQLTRRLDVLLDSAACAEVYGALGYLINPDDELD